MADWMFVQKTLVANSINITYYESVPPPQLAMSPGFAGLPILVFLHAMWLSGSTLIVATSNLTSHYRVVLPDARGHGYSTPIPAGSFRMNNLVDDAVAVISHVSPDGPVLLMGTSMGAATAARVARRHPSLIKSVILEEPPWIRFPGEAVQWSTIDPVTHTEMPDYVRTLKALSDEEFKLLDTAGVGLPPLALSNLAAWRLFDVDNCEGTLASVDTANTVAVPGIKVRALLQIGDLTTTGSQINGSKIQPEVAKFIVKTWKEGRLSFYPGGNHCLHEAPTAEAWQEEVLAFFGPGE